MDKFWSLIGANIMKKTFLVSFYNNNGDDGCFVVVETPADAIEKAKLMYPRFHDFSAIEYV
jgi:hypothetical protein